MLDICGSFFFFFNDIMLVPPPIKLLIEDSKIKTPPYACADKRDGGFRTEATTANFIPKISYAKLSSSFFNNPPSLTGASYETGSM